VRGSDLGAIAITAALTRSGVAPEMIDGIIFGIVLQAAETGYTARLAILAACPP